jgi:hypothetical protein
MATYNGPPPRKPGTTTTPFKPMDWDIISSTFDSTNHWQNNITNITSSNTLGMITSLPGELLNFEMRYDIDYLRSMGTPDSLELKFKKELAIGLVEKMIEDGHIVFTKQQVADENAMRFRAYTWVGNKAFIEEQRKRK